jgi:alginate O-acetyltransferase complex protein AlgI
LLFPTYIFVFLFGPVTIAGYWFIQNDRAKKLWLTVASYIFYGYWDWRFSSLLLIVTVVNYYAGLQIVKGFSRSVRRNWLIAACVVNLGILGFFKYFMLLAASLNQVAAWFGGGHILPGWTIILPIGISFFTFQAMSYVIDVYRGDVEPTGDFITFAAYKSLFPQLIAGPIVRYREIAETLRSLPKRISNEDLNLGFYYFSMGLIQKVLIADRIAMYINPMFLEYRELLPLQTWAAIIGYSLQLYYDFSGYSLMAIGLGHFLGFTFPQNFNSPYKAVSISDFWRRWHMTLSRWLKDYLYIPLGGRENRAIALAVTMLLGGLWHGPSWTFAAWGAYHAILLELHHHLKNFKWIPRNVIWARFGTFMLATIGWVFFRPPTFEVSFTMLGKMFNIPGLFQSVVLNPKLVIVILIAIVWEMFFPNAVEIVRIRKAGPKKYWRFVLAVLTTLCILQFANSGPFLYFQF